MAAAGSGAGGSGDAGSGGSSGGGLSGASGSAGTSGGSGGTGAGGAGGVAMPVRSAGCGMAPTQALSSWVEQPKLAVNGKDRQWWVWLPMNYDPTRAYPIVFTFHGCGGPTGFEPMEKVTGQDAIVVRGSGGDTGGCWQYSGVGDDVKFFDAMLADVENKRCADTSRVFLTGYSSGSWFANTLDCVRGDKIRGTGTVSGGVVDRGTCTDPAKYKYGRIFVHDIDDPTNYFEDVLDAAGKVLHKGQGNKQEVAKLIAQNHCMPNNPLPVDPAPCVSYQGCDAGYPVVLCRTSGKKHDMQTSYAPAAFWKLFSSL